MEDQYFDFEQTYESVSELKSGIAKSVRRKTGLMPLEVGGELNRELENIFHDYEQQIESEGRVAHANIEGDVEAEVEALERDNINLEQDFYTEGDERDLRAKFEDEITYLDFPESEKEPTYELIENSLEQGGISEREVEKTVHECFDEYWEGHGVEE